VLYAPLTAGAAAFVLAALTMGPARSPLRRFLSSRPLVFAGLASYGIFLWHDPLMHKMMNLGFSFRPELFALNVVVVVALTLGLAWASWILVERPALALKESRLRVPLLRPRKLGGVGALSRATPWRARA
jgi:peptidoglycan/LPS O-acetylase OafA/YrhL